MSTTTTSSTTAIDDKKSENDTTSDTSSSINYSLFVSSLVTSSLQVLIYIGLIGSCGLYLTKISQANILPDKLEYQPFGIKERKVEEIPININVIKKYGFFGLGMFLGQSPIEELSTKIYFDNKEIIKAYENGLVGLINSLQDNPERASYFGLYVRNIIFQILAINNWITNKLFNGMNKFLPESITLLLFPCFSFIIFIFYYILNCILCFVFQLKGWTDFFMNKSIKENNVIWSDPITYLRPIRWIVFFLYIFFLFIPFLFSIPIIITFYSLFSPLFISSKIEKNNQPLSFFQFFRDVLMFKSQIFIIIIALIMLAQSSTYLGTNGIIGCLVGILIAFFILHIFNQYIPTNDINETEGLVPKIQAKLIKKEDIKTTTQKGGYKYKKSNNKK